MLNQEALRAIVEAGVWAPSAENRHAFRYGVVAGGLRLYLDPGLANATADQHYVSWLSIGAVVENMALAASTHGLRLEVEPITAEAPGELSLQFAHADGEADELADEIKARHTNRRLLFRGPRLRPAQQRTLEAALIPLGEGWRLHWFDTPEQRRALSRLMLKAEEQRFSVEQLHRAMFSGIRFDIGWHAGAGEGLPPASLQIEPGMRRAFAALRHWPLMRSLARLGLHGPIALRASYMPARWAPHLVAVVSRTPLVEPADLLAAGRAMQRFWLAASRAQLAVQPLAAVPALMRDGRSALEENLRADLVQQWQALLPDLQPVMIFRLGRATPPAIRAGRPAPATLARR